MERKNKHVGPLIGQLIYFERIDAAPPERRRILARVALNMAGESAQYPTLLADVFNGMGWDEYQAALGLMALRANMQLHWPPAYLSRLRMWAGEPKPIDPDQADAL